jgi:hypothetical protein
VYIYYAYITTPPGTGETSKAGAENQHVVKVDVALAMAKVGAIMLLCVVVASVEQDGRGLDVKMHQQQLRLQSHWQAEHEKVAGREGEELEGEEGGG